METYGHCANGAWVAARDQASWKKAQNMVKSVASAFSVSICFSLQKVLTYEVPLAHLALEGHQVRTH